jgi:hypothetical protein
MEFDINEQDDVVFDERPRLQRLPEEQGIGVADVEMKDKPKFLLRAFFRKMPPAGVVYVSIVIATMFFCTGLVINFIRQFMVEQGVSERIESPRTTSQQNTTP